MEGIRLYHYRQCRIGINIVGLDWNEICRVLDENGCYRIPVPLKYNQLLKNILEATSHHYCGVF